MEHTARAALEAAKQAGATYADVRLNTEKLEDLRVRNARVDFLKSKSSTGIGIRVLIKGAWGFASTRDLTPDSVTRTSRKAVEMAQSVPVALNPNFPLEEVEARKAEWTTPFKTDPFTVPVEQKIEMLVGCTEEMGKGERIVSAEGNMTFWRDEKFYLDSAGSELRQTVYHSGGGISCYARKEGELQVRSYPNSFRGQYLGGGYEIVEKLDLPGNAARIAEEADQLLDAPQCPSGEMDIILMGNQLGLQIHESIGHAVELDRVLGFEIDFAGHSFVKVSDIDKLKYGNEIVNVECDATWETSPGSLGSFGFDDEGVKAQRSPIISGGLFKGFLSSRDTAAMINTKSNGTCRATSWKDFPIVRMTSVNLLPGESSLEEMIAGIKHGVLMDTNRSWSIDDKRWNFQFGTEAGWMIKDGKLTHMVKNPTYADNTLHFWNNCDAIGDKSQWNIWGTPNCGKGRPMQTMRVGHGTSPARFRSVKVGIGYEG